MGAAKTGTDVVKVEPPTGDITRAYGSRIGNLSSHYTQHNVGKRNICIDLTAEGAADLMLELAAVDDVLVENFRPGVMERHGLGWSRLHELNPKLIMLSISGFGQDGPERDRAAYAPCSTPRRDSSAASPSCMVGHRSTFRFRSRIRLQRCTASSGCCRPS